jgi:hypothetical protein
MDTRPGLFSERAGDHHAWEATAGTKVDPGSRLWRQRQELERIGDVARPDFSDRRICDQVQSVLPSQQSFDQQFEAVLRFT